MSDNDAIIEVIGTAFGKNEYPGDDFLQGSVEGCEPFQEIGPFKGKADWRGIEPGFLDVHAEALSFFSQAGFRFFLPAYLIADLDGQLKIANPLFHLTYGFSDTNVRIPTRAGDTLVWNGKSQFVNPRRYGATTFYDYSRYRLSAFTREEARAILGYLEYKRDSDPNDFEKGCIDAALQSYWLERARTAPWAESLEQHLKNQAEFLAATTQAREGQ
jgi:hypothetical protein